MSARILTRRGMLVGGARLIPALGLVPLVARSAAAAACADPADSLRSSLHYVEAFPDAQKTCSGCAFFTPDAGDCGNCKIFSGPANPKGHCDSWTAKS
jgi:hypothetical protein